MTTEVGVLPTTGRKNPGSAAAGAAFAAKAAQLRAKGALPLCEAAEQKNIDPDSAGVWAKRGLSKSAFRGPRRSWWVRSMEAFDADLESWRCSWDGGCERYALLSATGRCRLHDACVKRDGRLTAEEFATKHGLYPPYLNARLEAGDIPSTGVERKGRPPARMVNEVDALQAIAEDFLCETDGCHGYALGPSGCCAGCTTARMRSARWPESPGKIGKACPDCGSERTVYASLQRFGDRCVHCSIAAEDREREKALSSEGLVTVKTAAKLLSRSLTSLRSVVAPERRALGGRRRVRLGVNARDVVRLSTDPDASRKLSRQLSALNGTDFGRPRVDSDTDARIRELRKTGLSYRQIAVELGVSKSHVGDVLAAK